MYPGCAHGDERELSSLSSSFRAFLESSSSFVARMWSRRCAFNGALKGCVLVVVRRAFVVVVVVVHFALREEEEGESLRRVSVTVGEKARIVIVIISSCFCGEKKMVESENRKRFTFATSTNTPTTR